ncbi:MAG: oxygenase MpaB family protein [Segniliparus sp.]|uniref:oxygenase MpaB family protein n=1 Tax=Segniliparus sp. TaxID=2804064 RepID=UPI003F38F40D
MTAVFDQDRPAAESERQNWVQPVPDLVDPLGLMGDVAGRWVGLPVNSAAFILQTMHPVIGAVVDRYSVYDTDPAGRGVRSFDAVLQWFYGGKAAIEQGYWLREMHRPLQMADAKGKHISALNPEAYGWVVATAFVSSVWAAPLLLGRRYDEAEEEQLFQEIRTIARCLQVPENEFPATRAEFARYLDRMTGQALENTTVARNIVHNFRTSLRKPPQIPSALWPLAKPVAKTGMHVLRLLYAGVMPPQIRTILEIEWSARDERQLQLLGRLIRAAHRVLPERATFAPLAYHARKHQRIVNTMRERELDDFTANDKHARRARKAAGCPF